LPSKFNSFTAGLPWLLLTVSFLAGVALTLAGVEIPAFIYVIWGLIFFIVIVSALLVGAAELVNDRGSCYFSVTDWQGSYPLGGFLLLGCSK